MLLANSIASTLIEPIGTDLQSIFAGGLEEDAGEELGAGLHLEPLLDLLALAREAARREIVKIWDELFRRGRNT